MLIRRGLIGALAGFIATGPMTVAMLAMHWMLPKERQFRLAPVEITQRLLRRRPLNQHMTNKERVLAAIPLHFGYGAAAGGAYAVSVGRAPIIPVVSGLVYGLLVWLTGYQGWLPALRILPPASRYPGQRNLVLITAHVVWGTTLSLLTSRLEHRTVHLDHTEG